VEGSLKRISKFFEGLNTSGIFTCILMYMTSNTNTNTVPQDKAHKELGDTIREAKKVLGTVSKDATLLAYEAIRDAAYAVIVEGREYGQTTVSEAAFNEANELLHSMYDVIREHNVAVRNAFEALGKVTY